MADQGPPKAGSKDECLPETRATLEADAAFAPECFAEFALFGAEFRAKDMLSEKGNVFAVNGNQFGVFGRFFLYVIV